MDLLNTRSNPMLVVADDPSAEERQMGTILVEAGKLAPEDIERVLHVQQERGIRFGEAAIRLGLVTEADVERALARQFLSPFLQRGDSQISPEVVAAYEPRSAKVEDLRALRTQLMLRWFSPERKLLAVVSPNRGEGRSYLAANLAVVCSQLGQRTLLIDGDMRNPRQHLLFNLPNRTGLSAILSGRGALGAIERISSLEGLAVLSSGAEPPNPQDLISRPIFSRLLTELSKDFEIIIIDTPASGAGADAPMVAVRAGGALLVARKDYTPLRDIKNFAAQISGSNTGIVGAVLNTF